MQCLYAGRMRKTSLSLVVSALTAAVLLVAPSLASADTSSTLTVVGTSDVNDSGLIAEPDPAPVRPRTSRSSRSSTCPSATGAAIQSAENGHRADRAR